MILTLIYTVLWLEDFLMCIVLTGAATSDLICWLFL